MSSDIYADRSEPAKSACSFSCRYGSWFPQSCITCTACFPQFRSNASRLHSHQHLCYSVLQYFSNNTIMILHLPRCPPSLVLLICRSSCHTRESLLRGERLTFQGMSSNETQLPYLRPLGSWQQALLPSCGVHVPLHLNSCSNLTTCHLTRSKYFPHHSVTLYYVGHDSSAPYYVQYTVVHYVAYLFASYRSTWESSCCCYA